MILAVAFGVLIAVGITLCIVSSVADRVRSSLDAFLHASLNLMRVNANSRLNSDLHICNINASSLVAKTAAPALPRREHDEPSPSQCQHSVRIFHCSACRSK